MCAENFDVETRQKAVKVDNLFVYGQISVVPENIIKLLRGIHIFFLNRLVNHALFTSNIENTLDSYQPAVRHRFALHLSMSCFSHFFFASSLLSIFNFSYQNYPLTVGNKIAVSHKHTIKTSK